MHNKLKGGHLVVNKLHGTDAFARLDRVQDSHVPSLRTGVADHRAFRCW